MSREKSLAKNTILLFIGKICTQCISFFMLPLYTSVLDKDEYGTADLIITYVALLYPIVGLQLEQGLFRILLDYRDNKDNTKALFTTVLLCNIVQVIAFSILFVPLTFFVKYNYIVFLCPLVIIQTLQGTLMQFSRGVNRTDIYTIGGLINAILHVGLNVLLIGILKVGLTGLLYSIIIAGIGSSLFIMIKLRIWDYYDSKLFNKEELKSVAKYSIPLIPNQLAWWVINASDRTVVSFFLGTGANGLYAVANKFSSVYITFYNFFNMSWTESVSLSFNDKDRDEYINRMINIFFNLISAVCLGIIACMPFVFPILVPNHSYKAAYYQIPILMIAVFFQAFQGLYSSIYVALKKTKEIAKTSIFAAIINIVVNILLIKIIGLYAASVSTLVAFLAMALYRYIDIKKYVDISIKVKNIIFAILAGSLSCAAYYTENSIICLIALLIIILYSVMLNKEMLEKSLLTVKRKIQMIKRSK